jgi:hypothetical protein
MAKKAKKAGDKEEQGLVAAPAANQAAKLPPKAKPKNAAERRQDRIDGIKKTVYPAVLGVLAGFACYHGAASINQLPWHFVMLSVILVTYIIQRYTYSFLKIDANAFHTKDWFYVEFMAVDLWLVTWTLLLN